VIQLAKDLAVLHGAVVCEIVFRVGKFVPERLPLTEGLCSYSAKLRGKKNIDLTQSVLAAADPNNVAERQTSGLCVALRARWTDANQWLIEVQFKIPAADAVCVKVASSLNFFAHGSLQSFSTSDKIKGPKTDPPGGTTFDSKRVHFWTPFEIHLLSARVQNWALNILNPVPPGGPV
jgi:hypothetical protein